MRQTKTISKVFCIFLSLVSFSLMTSTKEKPEDRPNWILPSSPELKEISENKKGPKNKK